MTKSLDRVMIEYEWLTYRGWGGDDSLRQELGNSIDRFTDAAAWVERYMRKQQGFNQGRSSYGLKHICEKTVGQYISNGVMIAAFLAHDYEFNRIRQSWNVEFNVSECAADVAWSIANGQATKGYVYFIQGETGVYKIGMTKRLPDDRLVILQTASPVPLTLHRYVRTDIPKILERDLHQRFAEYRLAGEWFKITPEMIEDALCFY